MEYLKLQVLTKYRNIDGDVSLPILCKKLPTRNHRDLAEIHHLVLWFTHPNITNPFRCPPDLQIGTLLILSTNKFAVMYLKAKVDSGNVKKPSPGKSPAAWGASAAILADFTSDPHEDGKILVTKVTLDTRKLICQRLAPDSDTMSVEANCPKCGMPCYGLVKPRLIAPTDSQSFWSLPMQMFLEDEDDLYRRLSVRQ